MAPRTVPVNAAAPARRGGLRMAPLMLAALLVLIAFVLLVFGASADNPTSPAADRMKPGELPVRGITRITRHPMLWAFALWALAHLIVNGHLAGVLLFGAILVT